MYKEYSPKDYEGTESKGGTSDRAATPEKIVEEREAVREDYIEAEDSMGMYARFVRWRKSVEIANILKKINRRTKKSQEQIEEAAKKKTKREKLKNLLKRNRSKIDEAKDDISDMERYDRIQG